MVLPVPSNNPPDGAEPSRRLEGRLLLVGADEKRAPLDGEGVLSLLLGLVRYTIFIII
jgi:hypothetical protein